MLMSAHNGAVEHGLFVVRIRGQNFEYPLPDAGTRPARKTGVDDAKIAKPRGQVAPRDAGAIAVDNSLNKQAVIACRDPNVTATTRQEIFDAVPLVVPQGMAALCQRCSLRSFDGDGQGSLHSRGIGDTP